MNSANLTAAINGFGTAKEVARVARCSEATAGRYRRGETFPDPLRLARLMGRSQAIADAMLRLAGLDDMALDLREARLSRDLEQFRASRAARGGVDVATDAAMGARAGWGVEDDP